MHYEHTLQEGGSAGHIVRVYRYRLTDKRDRWLTMITPGDGPDEAWHILRDQYGADRVMEVVEEE